MRKRENSGAGYVCMYVFQKYGEQKKLERSSAPKSRAMNLVSVPRSQKLQKALLPVCAPHPAVVHVVRNFYRAKWH